MVSIQTAHQIRKNKKNTRNSFDSSSYKGIFHEDHLPATIGMFGFIVSFALFSLRLGLMPLTNIRQKENLGMYSGEVLGDETITHYSQCDIASDLNKSSPDKCLVCYSDGYWKYNFRDAGVEGSTGWCTCCSSYINNSNFSPIVGAVERCVDKCSEISCTSITNEDSCKSASSLCNWFNGKCGTKGTMGTPTPTTCPSASGIDCDNDGSYCTVSYNPNFRDAGIEGSPNWCKCCSEYLNNEKLGLIDGAVQKCVDKCSGISCTDITIKNSCESATNSCGWIGNKCGSIMGTPVMEGDDKFCNSSEILNENDEIQNIRVIKGAKIRLKCNTTGENANFVDFRIIKLSDPESSIFSDLVSTTVNYAVSKEFDTSSLNVGDKLRYECRVCNSNEINRKCTEWGIGVY